MLVTCFSTARRVITIFSAIAWFERPSAISLQHLALARRQLLERIVTPASPDELRDDGGVERRSALGDPPHRRGELVDVRDAVLEQVADALGVLAEQLHRVGGLDVLRKDEHAGVRPALADLLRRDASPSSVCVGGIRMSTRRDVGLVHPDVAEQILGRAALGDDLEPGVLEETRDSLAQAGPSRRRGLRARRENLFRAVLSGGNAEGRPGTLS